MNDTRDEQLARRLMRKFGISRESATKLIDAGLKAVGPVRRASNSTLLALGLSRGEVAKIRRLD